jgi:hypothetical protein
MQNQQKKSFNAFCSPRYVSTLMKKIVDLLMQTLKKIMAKGQNMFIGY